MTDSLDEINGRLGDHDEELIGLRNYGDATFATHGGVAEAVEAIRSRFNASARASQEDFKRAS